MDFCEEIIMSTSITKNFYRMSVQELETQVD